jgi:hypothetical protein
MASFAIFQILLNTVQSKSEAQQPTLNFEGGVEEVILPDTSEKQQEIFGNIFKDLSKLVFKENEGQEKPYPFKQIPCEENENIIILRIAANKKKNFEQNFTDVSEDWNPSSLVIIDNRKDIQRIAIQVKRHAFDARKMASMLQRVFAEKLKNDHIMIEIVPKMYSGDFWKVTDRYRGRIQHVKFDFTRYFLKEVRRLVKNDLPEGPVTKLLDGLEAFADTMHIDPSLIAKASNGSVEINKTDEQLQALVRVSAATGQPIKIVTLDGMSYDCYLTGGKEPTVWERKHDKIVVQDMPDYVVNRLMNFEAQEQSDIFNKEHFQNDITTLITFMNNLKLSYD